MPAKLYVHVIDCDSRRRASVARDLFEQNIHAEVYEQLDEFVQAMPIEGAVLAFDDADSYSPRDLQIAMRQQGCIVPIALYSDHAAAPKIVQAMLDGACDYLEWPIDPRQLRQAISRLRNEGHEMAEREQHKVKAWLQVERLTPREKDVLYLLAKGLSTRSMAITLKLSPKTVEIHRGNMMRKLRAESTADAVRIAIQSEFDQGDRIVTGLPLAA